MSADLVASIFENPEAPTWSSYVIDRLVEGGDRSKALLATLRDVDHAVGGRAGFLTGEQAAFARALTLRNYSAGEPLLTTESLNWLVEAFADIPTGFRALILTLLVPVDTLTPALREKICSLLTGSLGEAWLQEF